MKSNTIKAKLESAAGTRLLIFAQLLVLAAFLLGLQFILRTTGGSLFLAASLAPALAFVAVVITASLLLYRFQRRHSLFLKQEYGSGDIIFRKGDSSECA